MTRKLDTNANLALVLLFIFSFIISSVFFTLKNNHNQEVIQPAIKSKLSNQATPNIHAISNFTPEKLTLESIFSNQTTNQTIPEKDLITLIFAGDAMLGRYVNVSTIKAGNFTLPFTNTMDLLKSADITFLNLESPLSNNCPLTSEGMIFCANINNIQGLNAAGVDIANIANNHAWDQRKEGLNITTNTLKASNIQVTGLTQPIYQNTKGTVFSFLGYNLIQPNIDEIAWGYEDRIVSEIEIAKENSDFVIVSFHWGNEYTTKPTSQQIKLAHLAIDSGADVVIGHHPHWIQPVEIYKERPIFYSLGNFIFDQTWSKKTMEGLVVEITFYEDQIVDIKPIPVKLEGFGQPRVANDKRRRTILRDLKKISS